MTSEEIKLFSKMRKLISEGKRRFQTREDRDYLEDLLELGISEEAAWNEHIIYLNKNLFFVDPKPDYYRDKNALLFKKNINGIMAYIKLKIEENENGEEVVCISFHRDKKRRN